MVQEKNKDGEGIIVPWEESKKSTDYIPSVYIDRDFSSASSKAKGTSRGFGFVEFTHHVHALACLRELNNNPAYSREYVAGGKLAVDSKRKGKKTGVKGTGSRDARIPRLIVDFTVRHELQSAAHV
jgi:RNA recognition motif-containing protein